MSKRTKKEDNNSQSKKANNSSSAFIMPLLENDKFFTIGSNGGKTAIRRAPTKSSNKGTKNSWSKFINGFKNLENNSAKELSTFISNQLANQDKFQGVNLPATQQTDKSDNPMESYDFGAKTINLHPYGKLNPILKYIHEGTHALDDLVMKTYQDKALEFLAKHLKDQEISKDQGKWYTGAQEILPAPDFKKYYPYGKNVNRGALQNINDSMYNLDTPAPGKLQPIKTFKKAHEKFTELTNPPAYENNSEDDQLFNTLSEFPAYVVENISNRWIPPGKDQSHGHLGRKFLKKITKDVYKNFQNLEPNFSTTYPNANQSFLDRLAQLRNLTKHPDKDKYLRDKKFVPLDRRTGNHLPTEFIKLGDQGFKDLRKFARLKPKEVSDLDEQTQAMFNQILENYPQFKGAEIEIIEPKNINNSSSRSSSSSNNNSLSSSSSNSSSFTKKPEFSKEEVPSSTRQTRSQSKKIIAKK